MAALVLGLIGRLVALQQGLHVSEEIGPLFHDLALVLDSLHLPQPAPHLFASQFWCDLLGTLDRPP